MIFGAKTFDFAMQFTPGWPCTHSQSVIISTANTYGKMWTQM